MIKEEDAVIFTDPLRSEFGLKHIKFVGSDMSFTLYFNPNENDYKLEMLHINPFGTYVSFACPVPAASPIYDWFEANRYMRFVRMVGKDIREYVLEHCDKALEEHNKVEDVFGDVVEYAMSKHKYWCK
jgi:hypothetical protein